MAFQTVRREMHLTPFNGHFLKQSISKELKMGTVRNLILRVYRFSNDGLVMMIKNIQKYFMGSETSPSLRSKILTEIIITSARV